MSGFSSKSANKFVFPKPGKLVRVYYGPSESSGVYGIYSLALQAKPIKKPIGFATGNFDKITLGLPWYQVQLLTEPNGTATSKTRLVWVDGDEVQLLTEKVIRPVADQREEKSNTPTNTGGEAQQVVDSLLANQKKILANITGLDKSIREAKKAGKNVSEEEKVLRELVVRWARREVTIRNSNTVKVNVQPMEKLNAWIQGFGNILGLGEPITLTGIVIGAVVVAALALAALALFKPLLVQSQSDLDTSGQAWTAVKKKLTEQEQKDLEKDVQDQIDDAYTKGATSSNWGWLKTAGAAALAFFIIKRVQD